MESAIVPLKITPFSQKTEADRTLTANWAEYVSGQFANPVAFTASESEPKSLVDMIASRTVSNFRFQKLNYSSDERLYIPGDIYTLPELTPERSLAVTLTFFGDLPN